MVKFQPPGFGQKLVETSLGTIAYYTPTGEPWTIAAAHPTLMFLHSFGGGSSAYEWSKVYAAFANSHQVIAPDLIGWGRSAHPTRDYKVEDYLDTIAELMAQFSEPITLVASSLTGAIAVRLAVHQPKLVRSLCLVCPSGFADFGQEAGRRIPLQIIGTPMLDKLIYAIGATNEPAVRNFLEQFLFVDRDRLTNEAIAAYLESAQQPNAEYSALAFLRGDLYFDLSLYMAQLTIPTAILWGEKAQFTNVELGQRLAALNPQAVQEFQVVPDTGILPHLEQPGVVVGLLSRWLQKVQGREKRSSRDRSD
ncbi:MAG: alpha/beta hydrolase [Leptolyngbyaceae cyanobacterium SU_3_3]|nr:alpha/beta hydrolase [Leptolyngbyaceae cyanobacterium SU_3_3]